MVKAIIFDLDDTLYEEKQFVISGFKSVSDYISKKYNLDCSVIFEILKQDFETGLRKNNFDVLLNKLNINEPVSKLVDVYRGHKPKISLFPDAQKIINESKNKFKLGLITDGYILTQKNKIKALGIENDFDVITINDISKGITKKNKEPFLQTISKLEINPENTFYVGDNPLKDFVVSKKLGIQTIRIKRNQGWFKDVTVSMDYEADHVLASLLELPKIIENFKIIT